MADMKRFYGPAFLAAAAADLWTVAAGKRHTIRDIEVCNEDAASAYKVTLSVGNDAGGKRLFKNRSVPAEGNLQWTGSITLEAGEKIQAFADSASKLTITINGVEETP